MKNYKEVEYKTKIEDSTTCNSCGLLDSNWIRTNDHRDESLTIEHEMFSGSSGGGWGERYEVDICPHCFMTKVIPFLKTIGVNREYEEYDW